MTNLKKELLDHISSIRYKRMLCARLWFSEEDDLCIEDHYKEFFLRRGYSLKELESFLDSLDFDYGGRAVYGHIWYDDRTWSDRVHHDGYQWWEYREYPDIPDKCKAGES